MARVQDYMRDAEIQQWGKVRRVDTDEGDTMHAAQVGQTLEMPHLFGCYEMFIEKNAAFRQRAPKFELQTFYGQLQHLFVVKIPDSAAREALRLPPEQDTFIFAGIRTCVIDANDTKLNSLDIHFYSRMGSLDVVDITSVQCLVGRVKDREPHTWGIIDRSGGLVRALAVDEDLGDDDF
ncbi:hypothetical protein H0H81_003173 [Sphagnurus paluster]|uniref:Uncharacterized protein n=1 Tax=Sphagnurus paluster TaxID=117069 RepID=A0A9P7FNA9_9AGAR|nr:hypothetical protein H0H81_003173 [Sphagnurus paluster]